MGKIANKDCQLCSYGDGSSYPVCIMDEPTMQKDVMIITDSPDWEDAGNDSVMQSRKYAMLRNVLENVLHKEPKDYHLSYLVKCASSDKKSGAKEVSTCSENYLLKEIRAVNPKVIITLGEPPMNFLLDCKKITKVRGKIGKFEGIDVLPTFSPFYVENQPANLSTWVNDISKGFNTAAGLEDTRKHTKVVYCDTREKIATVIKYCQQTGVCCFDFETKQIDKDMATFEEDFFATALSLTFQTGSAYVIPLEHKESPFDRDEVFDIIRWLGVELFQNPNVRKIAHNLNFDFHVLRTYGVNKLRGRIDDTMLMQHLEDETKAGKLKVMVSDYFPDYSGYQDELDEETWENKDVKRLVQYAGTDTDVTYQMCLQLETLLLRDERSYIIYRNLTMAAFRPLWEAEERGMYIKREFIRDAIKEVQGMIRRQTVRLRSNPVVKQYENYKREEETDKIIDDIQAKLDKWMLKHKPGTAQEKKYRQRLQDIKTGKEVVYFGVLFTSVPQLVDLLYDSPYGFKFFAVEKATGKDIIQELPDKSGFIDNLLVWRSLKKTLSTYLEGIYNKLDSKDMVHTSFKLNGTVSGRLSSANPNLQNIPKDVKLKNEEQKYAVSLVKKSFGVPSGFRMLSVDYSQAELRVIAEFAGEDNMISVYADDGDIHAKTGASMLGVELEKFDKHIPEHNAARSKAKAVNFGFIYGMSAAGFQGYAKSDYGMDLTMDECTETRDTFFNTYPRLLDYHATYIAKARKFKYVRTLFGRRRHLNDIDSADDKKRSMDERVAVNSPIQGTAGEFTIFAIALLYYRLPRGVYFVNTVHDSIMFYIPTDLWDYTIPIIRECCENLPTEKFFQKKLQRVGMKVDFECSDSSWGEFEEIS